MPGEDEAKRAANEATFREANERIREAEEALQPPIERVPYLCECDDVHCHALVPLTREEYESIRSESTLFLILPGHSSQGEHVEERDGYIVVRKTGEAAKVAGVTDPRGDEP